MKRRNVMAGLAALAVSGCSKIGKSGPGKRLMAAAQSWHERAQKALRGDGLVPEFTKADISPVFKANGSASVDTPAYAAHTAAGFEGWQLSVAGLVEHPMVLSMENIRALPQRTQITRHDCVEGWSAIGEWTGPQLGLILEAAKLKPEARYILFRCADTLSGDPYYETIGLDDAFHPQTIVAHMLNGAPLPVANGAPLRLRVERQLGYKHAKYITGIEAISSFANLGRGKGGYWEDRGYQWHAGI